MMGASYGVLKGGGDMVVLGSVDREGDRAC